MDLNDNWYKLDNVSKAFLAAFTKRDPRTMRVSCTLTEPVDESALQKALDETIAMRPEFQVRVRRGVFWHYLEQTDARAVVSQEAGRPCPILYGNNYKGVLHYKVSYYVNRINIDIFHVISDGTGALDFLKLLVLNYLKIVHPGGLDEVMLSEGATEDERLQNSYDHFYDDSAGPLPKTILNKKKKAYHIASRKLPYDQLQFFEAHMETERLKAAADNLHVSMTSFIGAALMLAIRSGMPYRQHKKPITISLPVNLRNYYPSKTLRNFFNNVDVSKVFEGGETLESLAAEFDHDLKEKIKPEHITEQMNRYQSIERLFFTRMVPLALKQPVVRSFSRKESGTVTAVLSNLGLVKVPDGMKPYIANFTDYCSTEKLFITVTSYGGRTVLGIASAYSGTGVIREFVNILKETGTEVVLYASDVYR